MIESSGGAGVGAFAAVDEALVWRIDDEGTEILSRSGPLAAVASGLGRRTSVGGLLRALTGGGGLGLMLAALEEALEDARPGRVEHAARVEGRLILLSTVLFPGGRGGGVWGYTAGRPLERMGLSLADAYAVLETVTDLITVQAASGEIVYLNAAARRTLGLPEDREPPARPPLGAEVLAPWQVWDEHGRELGEDDLPARQALRGVSTAHRLIRYRPSQGGPDRWSILRATPVLDGAGKVRLAATISTDVTEIQVAREQLRRQDAFLRGQAEVSPDAILTVAPDGTVLGHNRRFAELWGFSPGELDGARDAALLSKACERLADPDHFQARVAEIYAHPREPSYDELQLRDGRSIERHSAAVIGEGGELDGRVWFFRDVTSRKQAERRERQLIEERAARAEAERGEQRWEFLAEVSRQLASSLDVEATLADVAKLAVPRVADCCIIDLVDRNGAARRAAVHPCDDANPEVVDRLRSLAPDLALDRGVGGALRQRASRIERIDPGRDEPTPSLARLGDLGMRVALCVPLLSRTEVLGVITFARSQPEVAPSDVRLAEQVAERAALALESAILYRRAQQTIAMRDEFLSVASHELRTPITALRFANQGLARALSRGAAADAAQVRSFVEASAQQERRLAHLVDRLLDVSRIQAGRLELSRERLDLAQLAREAAALVSDALAASGSSLHLDAPAEVFGEWDRDRLEQVLVNLLTNAIKYGAGQPIELTVRGDARRATVTVRDRGIGIAPEAQPLVFDRFQRAASPRHYAGLGLGLYIVRGIVEAHGGQVRLQSAPGAGSSFTVELPRSGGAA